jgi:hypothetical protein
MCGNSLKSGTDRPSISATYPHASAMIDTTAVDTTAIDTTAVNTPVVAAIPYGDGLTDLPRWGHFHYISDKALRTSQTRKANQPSVSEPATAAMTPTATRERGRAAPSSYWSIKIPWILAPLGNEWLCADVPLAP